MHACTYVLVFIYECTCTCVQSAAEQIVDVLWSLMETGQEELKLLQTDILLLTTNSVVQHDALAKVSPTAFCVFSLFPFPDHIMDLVLNVSLLPTGVFGWIQFEAF